MRIPIVVLFAFLLTGCLTIFGVHDARAREAFIKTNGACAKVETQQDPDDGWLWNANGCGKKSVCWYPKPLGEQSGAMRCGPDKPLAVRERIARAELRCPDAPLEQSDAPWWRTSFVGCERITWCNEERADEIKCTHPDDLDFALKQLSVESGCPVASIEQMQFYGTNLQNTYRLNACGAQYACIVPLVGDAHVAGSSFGSQLTCKPVAAAPVAPPPAP